MTTTIHWKREFGAKETHLPQLWSELQEEALLKQATLCLMTSSI